MVELRVVETVEEVNRPWARGRDAHAHLAGELRVAARHEGGHLLVADLDELRVPIRAVEGAQEGVDPVAGIAVHAVDSPLGEALQDVISDQLGHTTPPSARLRFRPGSPPQSPLDTAAGASAGRLRPRQPRLAREPR